PHWKIGARHPVSLFPYAYRSMTGDSRREIGKQGAWSRFSVSHGQFAHIDLKPSKQSQSFAAGNASCSLNDVPFPQRSGQQLQRAKVGPKEAEHRLPPTIRFQKAGGGPLSFEHSIGVPEESP